MRACWLGKRAKSVIRDTLMNDLKCEMLRTAKSVLGVARPKPEDKENKANVDMDDT